MNVYFATQAEIHSMTTKNKKQRNKNQIQVEENIILSKPVNKFETKFLVARTRTLYCPCCSSYK